MTVNLYSVFDILAKEYGPVFQAKNDAVASRNFKNFFIDNAVSNPEEYQLWQLGEYDVDEGVITPVKAIVALDTKESE